MKDFLYVYSTVHKESWKYYILTVLLLPFLLLMGILYVNLLREMLQESIWFYSLSVLGFPFFSSIVLLLVNHKFAKTYNMKNQQTKGTYVVLMFVGQGLSYILMCGVLVILATILTLLNG